MLTASQIRAARALLKWSAKNLAVQSGLSWKTIQRLESSEGVLSTNLRTIEAIMKALEAAGVIFISENQYGPGVRLKKRSDER